MWMWSVDTEAKIERLSLINRCCMGVNYTYLFEQKKVGVSSSPGLFC